MSQQSITELLYSRGIEDPAAHAVADEADYRIQCLESRLRDLEEKHSATRRALRQFAESLRLGTCPRICFICGAIGDEPCDAGLHG